MSEKPRPEDEVAYNVPEEVAFEGVPVFHSVPSPPRVDEAIFQVQDPLRAAVEAWMADEGLPNRDAYGKQVIGKYGIAAEQDSRTVYVSPRLPSAIRPSLLRAVQECLRDELPLWRARIAPGWGHVESSMAEEILVYPDEIVLGRWSDGLPFDRALGELVRVSPPRTGGLMPMRSTAWSGSRARSVGGTRS